jgi:LTXXQ motif family protein
MKPITKILAPLLLLGVAATAVIAQTAPTPPAASPGGPGGPDRMRRERPSPETMQRMQDGKIAFALAALKLDAAQLTLWAPVEAKIRERQAERAKMMQAWADRKPGEARPSMSERMGKMAEMMGKRAENTKAFAAVFTPFEASLTDEQKKVLGPVMAELSGGRGKGHGGGHRWGMNRGPGGPGAPQ